MVQFISSNPVTDQMNVRAGQEMAQLQSLNGLMDSRDARRQREGQDKAGRAIAAIFAEDPSTPAQVAPPAAAAAASSPQLVERAPPVSPTAPPLSALVQATPSAPSTFEKAARPTWMGPEPVAAPAMPVPGVASSPLVSVTAPKDVHSERMKKAIQVAAQQEGGGAMAMQLANQYSQHQATQARATQARTDKAHAEAIKAFGDGDFDLAKAINDRYQLGMDGVFGNPSAMQVSRALASSIKNLKMHPGQAIAYMDAASGEYAKSRDMTQAGMAGMKAASAIPDKAEKPLETSKGYFDQNTKDYVRDKKGNVVMPTDRRMYFNPNSGGGGAKGGSGDASKGAKFDVDSEGNRVILYRNGTMVYPKDAQGNPVKIKAGTDKDQEFTRKVILAGEKNNFETPADPVARAQELSRRTSSTPSAKTSAPSKPFNPTEFIRK